MANLRCLTSVCGVLLLFLLVCESKAEAGVGPESEPLGFIRTRGTQFVQNDSTFLFNGFNSYWMMNVAAQPSERYKITKVFREAAAAGLGVCRTWAFSDGGDQALQISPGVYNEGVFQALDFVISEATQHGICLILSLVNNYQDFGGRRQYVNWARAAGISMINNDDDSYTNAVVKGYYKNHVQKVVTRINSITRIPYKDDPTIMAWELINEPRCQVDYSGKTINMATYLKSLDNRNLLGVGMEGFYGDSLPNRKQFNPGFQVGTDFISNNLIKEIDFATIHAYPDIWLSGQTEHDQMAFMQRWMTSHWTDSRMILKKPLILSEFGKSKKDSGYSVNDRDSFLNTVYMNINNFTGNRGSIGGGLVWQIVAEGMESYYDGYEIVLSHDRSTGGVLYQQSEKMAILEDVLRSSNEELKMRQNY